MMEHRLSARLARRALPIALISLLSLSTFSLPLSNAQEQAVADKPTSSAQVTLNAADYVFLQPGELPIILSAPHGGGLNAPEGIAPRSGEGLETGPAGFFTGRDIGTEELARETALAIEQRFGKKPYVVASKLHRKFLDPNRPAKIALDNPAIQPVYDLYHQSLEKYCREVTNQFHRGVLLDIHGQGSRSDTVFRGTKNGLTVSELKRKFGVDAHDGPHSLFGLLQSRGWTVFPNMHREANVEVDNEQSGFTGGYIVSTYGSHKSQPIDAMQLEFGSEYRTNARRTQTANELADALADYAVAYMAMSVPARKTELQPTTPPTPERSPGAVRVALFVDAGVSSTTKLLAALHSDSSLAVDKLNAAAITRGELDNYSVVIHPGGSGSGQGKALGEAGRAKVKAFIESGHGMVGICAGAYLASCDYDWSLHVLDAKVIDRQHWNRGFGNVTVSLSQTGQELLKVNQQKFELYYHQGPLLAPASNPDVPDFVELAKFEGEIAKNGAPTGVMPGTTAIAMGQYGKGRVFCFSPHPEKTPNYESLVLRGIHWSANTAK